MIKHVLSFTIISFNAFLFGQNQCKNPQVLNLDDEFTVKICPYQSSNEFDKNKNFFSLEVSRNDSIYSFKYYPNLIDKLPNFKSDEQMVYSVISKKEFGEELFAVNRYFVSKNGMQSVYEDNDIFYPNIREINTYNATYSGGLTKLRTWLSDQMQDQIYQMMEMSDYTTIKFNLILTIDEDGKASLQDVIINANDEIKQAVNNLSQKIVNKMALWIPAKENGKIVKAKYNIPIQFVSTD